MTKLDKLNATEAQAQSLVKSALNHEKAELQLTADAVLFLKANINKYNDWKAYRAACMAFAKSHATRCALPLATQAALDSELSGITTDKESEVITAKHRTAFVARMCKSIENRMGYWERCAENEGWAKPVRDAAPTIGALDVGGVTLTPAEVKQAEREAKKAAPDQVATVYQAKLQELAQAKQTKEGAKVTKTDAKAASAKAETSFAALIKSKNARIRHAAMLFAQNPERVAALLVDETGKPSDLYMMA